MPLAGETSETSADGADEEEKRSSNFIPIVANFNIQYNFTSASIAVSLVEKIRNEPDWATALTLSVVFVGAMMGMLVMGFLGDMIGRNRAMRVTLFLAVAGCIVPACAIGNDSAMFLIIIFGRFILGIGVGGIYPLSAVSSAESSKRSENKGVRVGIAFFFQTVGVIIPYFVAMILLSVFKEPGEWVAQFEFRFLFAVGAIPGLIVLFASFRNHQSDEEVSVQHGVVWQNFVRQPWGVKTTLMGTAGSWFFFDLTYYGTSIFTPTILDKICLTGALQDGKCDMSTFDVAWQSVIVQSMGIPACLISIWLIHLIGSKYLNIIGFYLLAILFVAMAVVWMLGDGGMRYVLFYIFCAITFALNFGPNVGTFVLPAICFPKEVRTTCHGITSFGGKVGAVVGTLIFTPISKMNNGIAALLWLQAVMSICGAIVGHVFLKNDWDYKYDDAVATNFLPNRVSGEEGALSLPPRGSGDCDDTRIH